jgi:hypothetical protein
MLRSSARPDYRAASAATTGPTTAQAKEWILVAQTHCREPGFQPYPLLPLRDAPAR